MKKTSLALLTLLLTTSLVMAQFKTLERQYVAATFKTANEPLFGLNIAEWTAWRYDRATNEWQIMPFQFDQLTDNGRYDRDKDGVADATDEIVFMPQDAGDKADAWAWIDDESSQQYERIELQLADPTNPGDSAWVYLFRNVASGASLTGYLEYSPGPEQTPAADTIKSDAFILGHDKNGWIDYLALPGGKGDIIDRFKLRLAGKGLLIPAYEINEDFIEGETGADAVSYFPGPVRSFHIVKGAILLEKLNIPLLPSKSDFESHYEYTPYSFHIAAETDIDAGLLALFGVKIIRQSLDFNENARGMKVYSSNNRDGLLIDGEPDAYDDLLDPSSSMNWVMAAGEDGAVIFIVNISPMKNSRRSLYYFDNRNGDTPPDGAGDTGDGRSFGDMGLMIRATGDALITDRLIIDFKSYFLDRPGLDIEFGEKLIDWEQHPLEMQATEQTYQPLAVAEQSALSPVDFYLAPAYPNPYRMTQTGKIVFEFFGRKNEMYHLVVYNVLGRRVAQFRDVRVGADGRRTLVWNIHETESAITPGVYFYQLQNNARSQTRKLVIRR